jgi:predicted phage terminase large subunit-like protein
MLVNPEELPVSTDMQLAIEGALDPRSKEFRDAVKLTPATLAHYRTNGRWMPAEHLLYVSQILAHEIALGDARIIVEVPPRHGKSEEISVHTPIWFLEKYPWAQVILTTYAADLAEGFGRRVRDSFLLDDVDGGPNLLDTRIRSDVQRINNFVTTEGGGMASVGIGGPITGRGAHLLLVDDYIKNWAEASSDLVLQSIFDWFKTTAYTRLEPGGSCVILATRWGLNDLIGRLLEEDKERMWRVIRLPAIAEENDPLNRRVGEALWPERYPLEKLKSIRGVIGNFMFDAMYQQNPRKPGESKANVEMFKIVDQVENVQLYRWVRSWDLAATTSEGKRKRKSDWTVGTLIGTNGRPGSPVAQTAIIDMIRERKNPAGVETLLRATAESDGPGIPIVLEQEPGSSGKIAAEHLASNVLRGFRVTIKPPSGENKFVRAQPYIAAVDHGRIQLLRAGWNLVHKDELKDFPLSRFDDTVDSASQGYNELHTGHVGSATWGRSSSSDNGTVRGQEERKIITGATWGKRRSVSVLGD